MDSAFRERGGLPDDVDRRGQGEVVRGTALLACQSDEVTRLGADGLLERTLEGDPQLELIGTTTGRTKVSQLPARQAD